jgi:hypothetical protein
MFIPWNQLEARNILEVLGTTTIAQLRDRLLVLGEEQQHFSALIIRLTDGRIVPTVIAQIKELAKKHGRPILKMRLEDLTEELCPQPWEVSDSSPDYRNAEILVHRRRLPVVVISGGQRVGLVRREREITSYRGPGDAFDLYDLSIPERDRARFISIAPDTTMAELKQALAPLEGQPLFYLVLQQAKGGYGVTAYNGFRQALTDWLVRECPSPDQLWALPVEQLKEAFEPARLRDIEDISGAQAEQLARSRSLLLTEHGLPVGLYPGPVITRTRASVDTLFDFFDELLSRDTLAQTEFVTADLNTTIAKIALDLKALRAPGKAFVVASTADGSFGIVASRVLNRKLEEALQPADVWAGPLRQFAPHLVQAARAEMGTIGIKQAGALAIEKGFLVLTENGKPVGLLPRKVVIRAVVHDEMAPARATGLLFETPRGTLEGYAGEVQPEAKTRVVNLWFANHRGRDLDRKEALVLRRRYRLRLNIGQRREQSLAEGPGIREPAPETPEGTTLYVSLFSDDFRVADPTRPLLLPPSADSSITEFEVEPIRRTLGPGDRAALDLHIYFHCNLVQSWRLEVEVVPQGQQAQSEEPQTSQLLAARTQDYAALGEIAPRHLSLAIHRASGGGYRFDIVVASDEQPYKVQLGCRVDLRREDLTHLITKARRQLHRITRHAAYQRDVEVDAFTRRKALGILALLGRQLYSRLFNAGSPSSSAWQVGDWIQAHLSAGSTLQIINYAHDFVFPWSLIYDRVPWDEEGSLESVDPEGFWGFRYKIEEMTEQLLATYQESGVEIDAPEGLDVWIGINDKVAWGEDQRKFFDRLNSASGARAEFTLFDSRPELTKHLQKGDQHILYLYCHGFTERMATDIQLGDDLLGEFRTWLRTLPAEERAALRHQEDSLPNVSDSWIKLTYGEVPLTMMEHFSSPRFANGPLVFLNMCESAQVLPSLSGGFIPFFIQRGVRGIIGTECPMTSTFAHPFSLEFFHRFLQGQAVGQVLWELRQEFLKRGNPLGLAYTLYCDADMRLKQAVIEA